MENPILDYRQEKMEVKGYSLYKSQKNENKKILIDIYFL